MLGRPSNSQPKTAYDLRRIKSIVDVLALDHDNISEALDSFATGWQIDISGQPLRDQLRIMSRHALEYARSKYDKETQYLTTPC